MVRRDLEAEGGFGQFFADDGRTGDGRRGGGERPEPRAGRSSGEAGLRGAAAAGPAGVAAAAETARARGLTDRMGQLNHPRGGRIGTRRRRSR